MDSCDMENIEPTLLEFGQHPDVRPGSSKRKRSQSRDVYATYAAHGNGGKEVTNQDSHTPKRSRQTDWPINETEEASDAFDTRQRSVRRKHGKYGLSSINRRHAQETETRKSQQPEPRESQQTDTRETQEAHDRLEADKASRFLEGSMNDKPSVNPPSMFTRDISNHSLAVSSHSGINVDTLMDEYHQTEGDAHPSVELQQSVTVPRHVSPARPPPVHELFSPPKPPSEYLSNHSPETKSSSLYRFGHMVAKSFNPAHMWGSFSRTFRDTKDEMTARNVEENRRRAEEDRLKAQQKAEAEAKYAQMKAAGVFTKPVYTVVRRDVPPLKVPQQEEHEEREEEDEEEEDADRPHEASRNAAVSARHPSTDGDDDVSTHMQRPRHSESTGPGSPSMPVMPLRPKKSFFGSLRKPSFQNLKKTRSDYSLFNLAGQSSTSLEPQNLPAGHTLPRSHSKKELNKQHKLSKRVSDLELKLAEARRELTNAINTASPLPDFPTRFEKFTPSKHTPTITSKFRSKFIPGKLPSLPSERLLFTQHQPRPSQDSHGSIMELFTPLARTSSIATQPPLDPDATSFPVPMSASPYSSEKPLPAPPMIDEEPTPSAPSTLNMADYDQLDARLKALDDRVEGKTKKKTGTKKRKSDFEDKDYRPGNDFDDDDDLEAPKRSKKRKSGSKSDGRRTSTEGTLVKTNTSAKKCSLSTELPAQPAEADVPITTELNRTSTHVTLHSDPLDPISEEDNITSKTKHGSSIMVTVTQTDHRSTSHTSPNMNPRTSSPPPEIFLEAAKEDDEAIRLKPGVDDVPNLPNVSMRGRKKKHPKPSIQNFQWPDDVF